MKNCILILFFVIANLLSSEQSYSQSFGFGGGYTSENFLYGEFIFLSSNNRFSFSSGIQSNNSRGKLVSNQLPNYGRTTDGTGKYITAYSLGYGRYFAKIFFLGGELSIAKNNSYLNFIDRRFNGGGYHMITNSTTLFGGTIKGGIRISDILELDFGYSSISKINVGLIVILDFTD